MNLQEFIQEARDQGRVIDPHDLEYGDTVVIVSRNERWNGALAVRVRTPDGADSVALQCIEPSPRGYPGRTSGWPLNMVHEVIKLDVEPMFDVPSEVQAA
jgi:hypothetical protein